MNELRNAIESAGKDIAGLDLEGFVKDMGMNPNALTPEDISQIVEALPELRKSAKGKLVRKGKASGLSTEEVAPTPLDGVKTEDSAAKAREAMSAAAAGNEALVQAFIQGSQSAAADSAARMMAAAYGLTPLTLSLFSEALTQGRDSGHFEPESFRAIGREIVANAFLPCGKPESTT